MAMNRLFHRKILRNVELLIKTSRTISTKCEENTYSQFYQKMLSKTKILFGLLSQENDDDCSSIPQSQSSDDPASSFDWIKKHAPVFKLDGGQIEVIQQPADFYKKLKSLSKHSKKRILLASLYLGTGPLEQELVSCLDEALTTSNNENKDLRVVVLLDHMRASRGLENSRTVLLPLIKKFFKSPSLSSLSTHPSKTTMQLFLYHTPDLRGWLKQALPERFDEVVGLQHIKVYIFDDTVIISGANLNETYFVDRQDRYLMVRDCKPLADFYDRFLTVVSKFSFLVQPDNVLHYEDHSHHPYQDNMSNIEFRKRLKAEVEMIIKAPITPENQEISNNHHEPDTAIYPLVQMGPVAVDQDRMVTEKILLNPQKDWRIFLASGYLNLTDEYIDILLNKSKAQFDILTAAPQANSFHNSPGISKYIPVAYTHIARHFLSDVEKAGQKARIKLYEYIRPGWTVHTKGMWLYPPQGKNIPDLPVATLVGSPNYGYRSVKRDIESQLLIVTKNKSLRQQLHEEQRNIFKDSTEVTGEIFSTPERMVPFWVSRVTPYLKNFF